MLGKLIFMQTAQIGNTINTSLLKYPKQHKKAS